MDLSKLSDADLAAVEAGDISKVSPEGLDHLSGNTGSDTTSMAGRFATGFGDQIHGGAQLLSRAASDLTSHDLGAKEVDTGVRKREQEYKKSRGEEADNFDIWRLAGNVANPLNYVMPGAAGSRIVQAALGGNRFIPRVLGGGVSGGTGAALSPVTEGTPEDFWGEKGKQVGIGAAFGAGLAPITSAAARWISPNASRDPQNILARQEGIRQSIGQTLGGGWNALEERAQSIPLLGDLIRARRQIAKADLRTAAINRSQEPLGTRVAPGTGNDMITEAGTNFDNAYDSARRQLGGFRVDQQFQTDLAQLTQMMSGLPVPLQEQFHRVVRNNVTNNLSQAGGITAETYGKATSDIGKLAQDALGNKMQSSQDYGRALQQLRALMEQAAYRANPVAAAAKKTVDSGYGDYKIAQRAAAAANGAEGNFTPRQLSNAVKAKDRSLDKARTAEGSARMQDLSSMGERLGDKVPDSGTAGRLITAATLGGVGWFNPKMAALTATGGLAYTPWGQTVLRNAVTRRPDIAPRVANQVRNTTPWLAPLSALTGIEASADD